MKFTFDNHSRSVDKAREVVQGILGDNLVSVNPGTNDVRVSVETVRNITGEQQNSIAKALSQLPKVAEAANIPAKKAGSEQIVDVLKEIVATETPAVESPVEAPAVVVSKPVVVVSGT